MKTAAASRTLLLPDHSGTCPRTKYSQGLTCNLVSFPEDQFFQQSGKFLDIIIAVLLIPEKAVIPENLPVPAADRKPSDGSANRRKRADAFDGKKAPASHHHQTALLQIFREQKAAAETQGIFIIVLFHVLLLSGGNQNTGQALQFLQLHGLARAQRVLYGKLRIAAAGKELEIHIFLGKSAPLVAEDHVHAAKTQQIIQLLMGAVDDMNGDFRIKPGKFRDSLVELLTAVAAQIPDPQRGFIVLPEADGFPAEFIRLIQKPLSPIVKVLPRRRQGKAAVLPDNEMHAQFLLQRLNLLGNGRLRNEQPLRRLREAVAVNDGYEIFDLSKQQENLPPFQNTFSDSCVLSEAPCFQSIRRPG